ncbi:MAG: glucose 1-dehydrogenase [Actinomycetota bacterium]|jgi:threonine dehydrogenase-like Zn-dependent dehydrogenase|nr:glucose 1-dehydrogenase [Actinomycetota bacterium]
MRALTVTPKSANSARLEDIAEPESEEGPIVVETLAVGVCGTDVEIVSGDYGWSPQGEARLVLGHESLGRVVETPANSGFAEGDLVVGIVRRPDPVPCYSCAVGEWDECRNGQYVEHGIKQLDGFARERYRTMPDALVKLDPSLGDLGVLLEPTTVVAKAWEQADLIGNRVTWRPRRALVVGAGPIGLLAALMGVQQGLEVHVLDQVETGLKPDLVQRLGAHYHTGKIADAVDAPDVIVECTGVPQLVADSFGALGTGGVLCLAGVSPTGRNVELDLGSLARDAVLGNKAIFGSVNANRRHYVAGADALAKADKGWLGALISRRIPLEHFEQAFERQADDVKVVIELKAAQ